MSRDVSLPQAEATSGCRLDSTLWLAFNDSNPEAAASPRGSPCSLLLLQSTCADTLLSVCEAFRISVAMHLAAASNNMASDNHCYDRSFDKRA